MYTKLLCGAAKAVITPSKEWIPNLAGLMGKHFSGVVFDDLYLRVIALKNTETTLLFISFDLDKAPNPETNLPAISEKTGIPIENILYCGIHTHTAPITGLRPWEGPNSKDKKPPHVQAAMNAYEAFLQETLLSTVQKALDSLRPARFGWNTGTSYIGENRCQTYRVRQSDDTIAECCSLGSNPTGPVDRTVLVMGWEDLDGKPIAFFVNYAVHCCVMICNNSDGKGGVGISGDLAGGTSQMIETQYDGAVALWCSGAAGDVNPVMMNQYYIPDPVTGASTEFTTPTAEPALAFLKLLTHRHFADIRSIIEGLHCTIDDPVLRAAVDYSQTPLLAEDGSVLLRGYQIRVHPMQVGDVGIFGVSGELYTTLGAAVKDASPCGHTCIVNHNACLLEHTGYIMDDNTLARCAKNLPGHFIPGYGKTKIVPGYIRPSLSALAKKHFR